MQEQQNPNLPKTNITTQSVRGTHSVQPHAMSMHSTATVQQSSQNVTGISSQVSQQEAAALHFSQNHQREQLNQLQNHLGQIPMSPLIHMTATHKANSLSTQCTTEDKEVQRRQDELKRKQIEFDENLKRKDEESKQQQQQQHQLQLQQMYQQQQQQQQQHSQSQQKNQQHSLHPSILRLENLVINGPNVSSK